MKFGNFYLVMVGSLLLAVLVMMPWSSSWAEETLVISSSYQVSEALGREPLDTFTKKTGIPVTVSNYSSYMAFYRLMNGYSDVATVARRLRERHQHVGFVETPFCKDPMAIIVNAKLPVGNLTDNQLRNIFKGAITNWKAVGGPDLPICIVIPDGETAANRNFRLKVMFGDYMVYDICTSQSTDVIEVVANFPESISFIAHGAARYRCAEPRDIKVCKINGFAPEEANYPYHQIFTLVTKGKPAGAAKKFVDLMLSEEGKGILTKKGLLPYTKLED